MQKVGQAPTICRMNEELDVTRLAARAPLRTIRTSDLAEVYAHPRQEARAVERRGLLHRLAHGFYCAVPPEHDAAVWHPTIEAAAAGIATAIYGDRVPVLTGLTAARVHRALPRAIGVAFVAVPAQRRPLELVDRPGRIHFVMRAVADLDAVLVTTDLGQTLATTPEQTVLDLGRADPRGEDVDAREAIAALWPECDQATLDQIAGRQRMRATLKRLRAGR
jgi:predicted transcriptional regulator of viral defense system